MTLKSTNIYSLVLIILVLNVNTQESSQLNLQTPNSRVNSIPAIESTEHIAAQSTIQASQLVINGNNPNATHQQPGAHQTVPNPTHLDSANTIPPQIYVENTNESVPQKPIQINTPSNEPQSHTNPSQQNNQAPNTQTIVSQNNPQSPHVSSTVEPQPNGVPQQGNHVPVEPHPHQATLKESEGLSLHSLTDQQRKKMLEEEALLTAFHKSHSQDFSKFANMTMEQLQEMQRKMHKQAQEAYQNALRDMQDRQKKERQELQRMIEQEKLSKTQNISIKETMLFTDRQSKFNPKTFQKGKEGYFRHHFDQYMFELQEHEYEDFYITLSCDQEVALYSHTYQNVDGIYSKTEDIGNSQAPEIYVYNQEYDLVTHESFYFKTYIIFQGKEKHTYTIRTQNKGNPHLFSLSIVQLIDHNHISHTITFDHLHDHGSRAINLYEDIKTQIEHNHNMGLMSISNQHKLNKGISQYYIYNLAELGLIVLFCLVQIKMIERLLGASSVV